MLHYETLVTTTNGKIQKGRTEIVNLKHQKQNAMKSLNFLMNLILHYSLKIVLSKSSRSMKH